MTTKTRKSNLEWALEYKSKGIKVVRTYYKGKCPGNGGEWERYRTEPITEELLHEWFGPDASYCNISAITGVASGGLTVLDFDSEEAYRWWADKYPDYAAELPTSKSKRGCHVYFRSKLEKDVLSLPKMDIKAKGLISLPPSMHKSGKRYEWIIPLPDSMAELPMLNPYGWNLEEFTDGIDGSDGSEGIDGNEGVGKSGLNTLEQLRPESKRMILEAIDSTLPTGHRQR